MVRLIGLFGAVAFCFSTSAVAQTSDQAVIDQYWARWNDGEGLKLLNHLAKCVAERHPAAADAFVTNTTDATALQKDQEHLVDTGCIKKYWFRTSSTTIDPEAYRPMLAEALLTTSYSSGSIPAVNAVTAELDRPRLPNVPIEKVHPYYRVMFLIDKHNAALAGYGECIVRQQQDAVLALAVTPLNSEEEATALAEIEKASPNCDPYRPDVSFPSYVRRGDLMLQLYSLTRLAGGQVPQSRS